MDDVNDVLQTKLVEVDITPEQWPLIIRSRLAFGLVLTYVMTYAPREVRVTHERMTVRVPEKMDELWEQWTRRMHRQCDKLLMMAQTPRRII